MSEEEKKMALALREWALQKVFGPALTEIEEDLRKLYAKGRDKLILAAYRKAVILGSGEGIRALLRRAMKRLPIAATAGGTFASSSYRLANPGDKAEVILGSPLQKAVGHGGRANTKV